MSQRLKWIREDGRVWVLNWKLYQEAAGEEIKRLRASYPSRSAGGSSQY